MDGTTRQQYAVELRQWWALAWPTSLRSLADLLPWLATLTMVGRVGTQELAALSLTESWLYGLMTVPWIGLTITESTLVAQAHGSKNVTAMRGWLAQSMIAHLLLAAVVAVGWAYSSAVLQALGFDPVLTELGQKYATAATPVLFAEGISLSISTYLTSMQVPLLPFLVQVCTCGFDIGLSYYLILQRDDASSVRLQGAAYAWVAASLLSALILAIVLRWAIGRELLYGHQDTEEEAGDGCSGNEGEGTDTERVEQQCEPQVDVLKETSEVPLLAPAVQSDLPFSNSRRQALRQEQRAGVVKWLRSPLRWRTFLGQAGPNLASAAMQSWQLQVLSFLAAELGAADIATHNAMIAVLEVIHTGAQGMAEATGIRVGYHLGKGDVQGAKRAASIGLAVESSTGILLAVVGYACRDQLGRIFSDDPAVLSLAAYLAPAWAVSMALWCISDQLLAVLEGQGRATAQAVAFMIGGWLVTLPCAVLSWKFTEYGLVGIWASFGIGTAACALIAWIAVLRSNWQQLAEQARGAG